MGFRTGDAIAGRYVVEGVIASGGMGVIYSARHLVLDERVAIKCLLPELSSDAEQSARLIGEARAAAKIRNEHVARIIDADRLPDGTVFLAMERLDGLDLGALLEEQRTLPVDVAIAYVLQAGEALAEAHACGIIHRDLKPANLFAARRTDGSTCIKVLDFGISKVLPHEAQVRTRTGVFMGTPIYASPEQLAAPADVDRRTDIWALGCVLYELVAGEPPFVRDTMPALVAAIVSAPAPSLATKRPDIPAAVGAAIARCLEKDRARRWNDIAELASALAPFSPAQAAVSLPRIHGLARASGALPFAATDSGHSLPIAPAASTAPAVSGHAPTIAVWNPASTTDAPRRSSSAAWIVAGVLAVVLTGATIMRSAHRSTPVASVDDQPANTTAGIATATALTLPSPASPAAVPPGVDAGVGAAPSVVDAPLPTATAAASRVSAPLRPDTRRTPAAPSPSGKPDDWMRLKE